MEQKSTPTHNWIWEGRIDDPTDDQANRIHQVIQQISPEELSNNSPGITLVGYQCDEGVRRNKGRIGAADGPKAIRRALGSMALHTATPLYDLGDCICVDDKMEITQDVFATSVSQSLSNNQKLIGIGGGHDIAYAHGKGVFSYLSEQSEKSILGIINLDAHFDLRQPKESTNSGTPFYQLAQQHPDNFHYLAVGIQKYGNTQRLFTTAKELGASYILRDDLQSDLDSSIDQIISFIRNVDHIYLTIDLDGIDSSICPGVSAPATNGMTYREIQVILETILESKKLLSMDVAELNPRYDLDNRTAKVAAYLIHWMMERWRH